MQRISRGKNRKIAGFFIRLFLEPSLTSQTLQAIFALFQCLIFTILINSQNFIALLQTIHNSTLYMISILLALLLIRMATGRAFIRPFYLLFLVANGPRTEYVEIICYILVIINLSIDVLSRIQFQFDSMNPYSESINHCKFAHYFVLSAVTILETKFKNDQIHQYTNVIGNVISLCLFGLLIIIKSKSACKKQSVKSALIRFYLLSFFYQLKNIIAVWVTVIPSTGLHLLVILISQLLFFAFSHQYRKIQFHNEINHGSAAELVFKLLSYQMGTEYNRNCEQVIQQIIEEVSVSVQGIEEKQVLSLQEGSEEIQIMGSIISQMGNEGREQNCRKFKMYEKMEEILENYLASPMCPSSITYILLLKAQISIQYRNQIIIAKRIVQEAKQKCSPWAFIERICIFKVQLSIRQKVRRGYSLNKSPDYEDFLKNQSFRTLLVKNSYSYYFLWEELGKNQVNLKNLGLHLNKVLRKNKKIDEIYDKKLKIKCNSIVYLFMDYLQMVKRDTEKANQIFRNFEIDQRSQHNFKMDHKIYLAISLEVDFMKIQRIGGNVKKLLGYDGSMMTGLNISVFLPNFFEKIHNEILIKKVLNFDNSELSLFQKNTIAKHSQNYYLPCIFELKLVYSDEGKLRMEGFMEIINDKSYDWLNYFILKSEEQKIIEVGPALSNVIQLHEGRATHYSEHFTHSLNSIEDTVPAVTANYHSIEARKQFQSEKHKKYMEKNGLIYEYNLLKELQGIENRRSSRFYYYVCKSNTYKKQRNNKIVRKETTVVFNMEEYLKKFLKFCPYPLSNSDTNIGAFLIEKQKMISSIKERTLLTFFAFSLIIILCVFATQIALILRAQSTSAQDNAFREDFKNIVTFSNALTELGMRVAIANNRIKYGQQLDQNASWPQLCETIEKTNSILSHYSTNSISAYKRSIPEVINIFTASIHINFYLRDRDLISHTLAYYHKQFLLIYSEFSQEYINGFKSSIVSNANQNILIKYLLEGVICSCIIVLFIIIMKMESIFQQKEQRVMSLFAKINASHIFIAQIQEYLRKTIGDIDRDFISKWSEQKVEKLNKEITMREDSMRAMTIEEFAQTTRKISTKSYSSTKMKQIPKVNEQEKQKKEIKGPLSKRIIGCWLMMSLAAIFIPISYIVYFNTSNVVTLKTSIMELINLFDQQSHFSYTCILYVDSISHEGESQAIFEEMLQKYRSMANQKFQFNELVFSEFAEFAEMMQKLKYASMCQYMHCDPLYKNYVNIVHSAVIQKVHNYMMSHLNDSDVARRSPQFESMIYARGLLTQVITGILGTYDQNYQNYHIKQKRTWAIFSYLQVAILMVVFVATLLHYFRIRRQINRMLQILDLIKSKSYK